MADDPTPSGKSKFDLGKQIGPLPVGGWIAVIVAGVGLAWYANKRQQAASTAAAPQPTTPTDVSGVIPLSPGGYQPANQNTTTATSPTFLTNDQWRSDVESKLLAQGNNPTLVDGALTKYLNGVQLTAAENAVVSVALTLDGPPPIAPILAPAPTPIAGPQSPGPSPITGGVGQLPRGVQTVATVLRHDGNGGYMMDSWGGIHPFSYPGRPLPPKPTNAPYWPGKPYAKSLQLFSDDSGGEVTDVLGKVHTFSIPPIPIAKSA
jgi:hypothetical protein